MLPLCLKTTRGGNVIDAFWSDMSLGNVGVGFPKIWDFFVETISKDFQRGSGHHGGDLSVF